MESSWKHQDFIAESIKSTIYLPYVYTSVKNSLLGRKLEGALKLRLAWKGIHIPFVTEGHS